MVWYLTPQKDKAYTLLSSEAALEEESCLLNIISIMQGNLISQHNYSDFTLHLQSSF